MVFMLFLSCTSPYKIWIGDYSIGLTEIGAWVFILWRWMTGGRAAAETGRIARWLIRGLWAIAVWAGILWLLSVNWAGRREMFLDWVLAALVFSALLRSPVKVSRLALIFVLAAIPNAVLGVVQHLSGIGLAPKDFTGWREGAAFFPVYGFFGHSNDLAVFLYWPFLLSAGLAVLYRGWSRLLCAAMLGLFGLTLYWTVSRSTLLTLGVAAVILGLMFFLPRKKAFLAVMAVGVVAAILLVAGIFLTQPLEQINVMLSGRWNLWGIALQVISGDPLWLPFGYLAIPPAELSIFYLPHNIYLLSWIEYGWPGILLLIGMAVFFISGGVKRYAGLRLQPAAACLWAGLAGLFLVNGMVILYLHEPYVIVNFMCVAAIWIFMIREIDAASAASQTGDPALPKPILPGKPAQTAAIKKRNAPKKKAHRSG
ncbi:MAG: O-antigen ligase family protein [Anaerolineales bacterium]